MSQYAALRANVGLLGTQLGDTVRNQLGPAVLERIEQIRQLAKQARQGTDAEHQQLKQILASLTDDEILPVARAFSQFLNLANLAEQHHTICKARKVFNLCCVHERATCCYGTFVNKRI